MCQKQLGQALTACAPLPCASCLSARRRADDMNKGPRRASIQAAAQGLPAFILGSFERRLSCAVGGPRSSEVHNESAIIDRPGGGCARYRQRSSGHEQRLQEQPSHVVRSNFRRSTPREDWAQLSRVEDSWTRGGPGRVADLPGPVHRSLPRGGVGWTERRARAAVEKDAGRCSCGPRHRRQPAQIAPAPTNVPATVAKPHKTPNT